MRGLYWLRIALTAGAAGIGCGSEGLDDEAPIGRISWGGLQGVCGGDESSCERDLADDPWWCLCEGQKEEAGVEAATCEDALAQACDVAVASECFAGELGVCLESDDSEDYECSCGSSDLSLRTEDRCMLALSHACMTACEMSGVASCEPTGGELEYECACSYYDGVRVVVSSPNCLFAARECEPGEQSGNGWCKDLRGRCQAGSDGYDCHCVDGTSRLDVDEPACSRALSLVCGEVEVPADLVCEDQVAADGETWDVRCQKTPGTAEPTYECECGTAEVTDATTVGAETCAEAIAQACLNSASGD